MATQSNPYTKFIIAARGKKKLSQIEIAKHLGYSSSQFVSNWERGLALIPPKKMPAFAQITGCDLETLRSLTIRQFKIQMDTTLEKAKEALMKA